MADQLDSNTRAPNPDQDGDDPLAELARIIGYEKPAEANADQQVADEIEASAFDLEAELMRELDVLPASGTEGEPEADTIAQDVSFESDPGANELNPPDSADAAAPDDVVALDASWLDNKPQDMEFDDDAPGSPAVEPLQPISANYHAEAPVAGDVDELGQVIASGVVSPVAASTDVSSETPGIAWPDQDADAVSSDVFDVAAEEAWQGADGDQFADAGPDDLDPDFGAGASDPTDDDVLADMVRFDLPGQGSEADDGHLAQTSANEQLPSQSDADDFQIEGADAGSTEAGEFDLDLASVFDDIDAGPSDNGWAETTGAGADTGELTPAADDVSAAGDVPIQSSATADSIDFEDYLSAELDVFGYETANAPDIPVGADLADSGMDQNGPDLEPAQTFQSKAVAEPQAEPVSDVDIDAFEPASDETELVFDEAAEELLADIEQDAAIAEAGDPVWPDAGADDAGSGYTLTDEPVSDVPPADAEFTLASDATEGWSDADIGEGLSEELSEELEDSFGLAPQGEDADGLMDAGELELDLEQVLAETVIDDAAAADPAGLPDDALAEAPRLTEDVVAQALENAEIEAPHLIAEASSDPERDEMERAFLGLVPETDEQPGNQDIEPDFEAGPEQIAAATVSGFGTVRGSVPEDVSPEQTATMEPGPSDQDNDWLAGFEPAGDQSQSDDDAFFFDASTISEPEEPVQPVAEIDVPEIADDEPRPAPGDYDADIEREFADIIDLDASRTAAVAQGHATQQESGQDLAGEWGVEGLDGPGYEASDDYIALERELGVEDPHVAPPYGEPGNGGQDATSFDGEYAAGMSGESPPEKDSRGPMVAAAVLGVALLAGVGAFGWSMLSGGDTAGSDGPRIIRADKDPVKVLPENPGGVTVPNQDKAVYDRVAGGNGAQTGQPSLVNTAEEPVDVVQRTLDPDMLPLEGRDAPVKSEERLAVNGGDAAASGADGAPVVSPRRVRTMIVKPDGSIVAREDPAPEVAAPVTPVAEPIVETARTGSSEPQPAAAEDALVSSSGSPQLEAAAIPETGAADAANGDASQGTIAPVRVVTTQPIRAPIPQGRPADQPVTVVGTVTQGGNVSNGQPAPAAPAPAAAAQPVEVAAAPVAAAPAANPGGYYMQIASQPTAEGAQASWRTLSNRFSSVLGGRAVDIQRADIPNKGVFHRVRVPAGSRAEANALCSRYKAAGGSCFVSR
ncbi:SPOR domain-containing protein [uncultured Hoeflea sp.]|uniref:SPOR domain-containing protein n=1 Tax=uncultured Hoeflea sp. TaxID=538666 RepID=UPI0026161EA4|nr:SPOR domain-containing protein [uncultured Hoeflea sp.]